MKGPTVEIRSDNTTTVTYINHMGGKVDDLNALACELRALCFQRGIQLQASYVPGQENDICDKTGHHGCVFHSGRCDQHQLADSIAPHLG